MNFIMTSVKDDAIGYMPPMAFTNERAAKRWFYNNFKKDNPSADDYHLTSIGNFDDETGDLTTWSPERIEDE